MAEYYPFSAACGQENVKKALIYNLIEPRIGGVLLCGEKGTAKSTIVRGIASLTDRKVVDVPLSITEDMLVGSVDFEAAVKSGRREFFPGLLKRADGNIMYIDEVNLLPDGIVDTIICASLSGENIVEREGISYRHPCRFVLVGSMNPEEGRLRPQFLDRFGLYVQVEGEKDIELRTEIIRRRLEFEKDPAAFCAKWEPESRALKERIEKAAELAALIEPDDAVRTLISRYAVSAGSEGNRCELILARCAAAVAAWNGRDYISAEDIKEAAFFVLAHRTREQMPPPDMPDDPSENSEDPKDDAKDPSDGEPDNAPDDGGAGNEEQNFEQSDNDNTDPGEILPSDLSFAKEQEDQLVQGEEGAMLSIIPVLPRDRAERKGSGRRSRTKSGANKGRYASFTQQKTRSSRDLALDATLRAAAPFQAGRDHSLCAVALKDSDLRYKVREDHIGATVIFAVDASGSMGAQKRMKAAKDAILSMLMDSYQKRDKVGLVAFRKDGAETLMDITSSVDLAEKSLQQLPTGGRTPLAEGIYRAWQMFKARRLKDPDMLPILVLVTDGRANKPLWSGDAVEDALKAAALIKADGIHSVVIDTEKDFISLHIARQVAEAMGADYYKVSELAAMQLKNIVQGKAGAELLDI